MTRQEFITELAKRMEQEFQKERDAFIPGLDREMTLADLGLAGLWLGELGRTLFPRPGWPKD